VTKQLSDILLGVGHATDHDVRGVTIRAVTADSRKVEPGSLFICIVGLAADGHAYVEAAAAKGAAAIVANHDHRHNLSSVHGLPVIWVEDSRKAMGDIAAAFYDHPAAGLILVGLTGTNGKTTTSFILEAIIRAAGGNPGVIGTVNYRYGGREFPAPFTTPEPLELQRLLREMADDGVTHVIMEVSSHALAQHRIQGLLFDAALFTNLTRDHLDFHHTMEAYYQAKKRLFVDYLKDTGAAVVMVAGLEDGEDSDWGRRLYDDVRAARFGRAGTLLACGLTSEGCDVSASDPVFRCGETAVSVQTARGRIEVLSNLVGRFNLKNIVGAVGVAEGLGLDLAAVGRALRQTIRVPGRLEAITVAANLPLPAVFVDYAHTPDALENVLTTLRQLGPQRLLVVFGCGGDRDPGKRPLMGEIAGRLADVVIITADNSRSESTADIMAAIERGVAMAGMGRLGAETGGRGYAALASRDGAIAEAIGRAGTGDIVLISGKGHETYQITNDGVQFFDDRLEAAKCLKVKAERQKSEAGCQASFGS